MTNTEITFRDIPVDPSLEDVARDWASRLENLEPRIERIGVLIARPHRHHRSGQFFHVRIDVALPDHPIVVSHEPERDGAHADAYVALADAFRAARRQLQDTLAIRREKRPA